MSRWCVAMFVGVVGLAAGQQAQRGSGRPAARRGAGPPASGAHSSIARPGDTRGEKKSSPELFVGGNWTHQQHLVELPESSILLVR